MKAMKQTDFWDLTFFHHVRLGAVYHAFLREVLPELLQNMDLQTGILLRSMHDGAAPYLISWFSGILEPPVAGTTDRTWWTNSKACSFSGFTTLNIFISGHICSLLFKLQKSVTSTTFNSDTEWIRDDSHDTRNFQTNQAIAVETRNVLHWSSRWTLRAFSLTYRRPSLGDHASERRSS